MDKSDGKNVSKNFLIMVNNLQQMNEKLAEAIDDLIGDKIADRITRLSKNSQQNNSETVTDDYDKAVTKKRCMYPKERQKIIHDLRLI